MDVLRITIIGQDLFKIVEEIFEETGFNSANQVNPGMLGNLKTLTYWFELPKEEIIERRAKLMSTIAQDNKRLMALYVHGNWMRVFVLRPIKA